MISRKFKIGDRVIPNRDINDSAGTLFDGPATVTGTAYSGELPVVFVEFDNGQKTRRYEYVFTKVVSSSELLAQEYEEIMCMQEAMK